jgi:hypothetical protein
MKTCADLSIDTLPLHPTTVPVKGFGIAIVRFNE